MKAKDTVISHFSHSVDRYTDDILQRDQFVMKACEAYADQQKTLLELGCGTGHCLENLKTTHPSFSVYGLDITPAMIKTAKELRSGTINFMVGDCLQAPFPGRKFDIIIIYSVLHHLISDTKPGSDELRALGFQELIRLLAPAGTIILEEVCVNKGWRARWIFALSHLVSWLHINIPALHIHTDVVLNFYTLDELFSAFKKAGLRVELQEIDRFPGLGAFISTFGDSTYHVRCILRRAW